MRAWGYDATVSAQRDAPTHPRENGAEGLAVALEGMGVALFAVGRMVVCARSSLFISSSLLYPLHLFQTVDQFPPRPHPSYACPPSSIAIRLPVPLPPEHYQLHTIVYLYTL